MRWLIARLASKQRPKIVRLESPIRTLTGGGNDYTYNSVKSTLVEVPDKFNFAQDVIDDFASRDDHKDRDALFHVSDGGAETHWSYSDLSTLSKKAAAALSGLQAGRAVTVLPRVPEWWLLNVAALRSGTVLLPGTTLLSASDLAHRMTVSGADTVIADAATALKVEEALGQMKSHEKIKHKILVGEASKGLHAKGWVLFDDLMSGADPIGHRETDKSEVIQVFFTSGTTGAPKMVPHTQASYGYCHRLTGEYWLDLTADDVHWNISDTGWAKSAWSSVFAPWSRGACAFAHAMARFSSRDVLRALDRYPVTTLCAPPTLYRSLVLEDLTACSFPTLRHCVSAGEPLNEEVILSWEAATGILIKEGYGQTETTLVTANFKGLIWLALFLL